MPVRPVRGPAVRELGLRLPPTRMAPFHRGRPLKRWRYIAVYGPELMLCVGDARIAGLPQRWWAVALPDGTLMERTTARRVDRAPAPGWVLVDDGGVRIELTLEEAGGVEVVSPHGDGWIWTRKQAGLPVRGRVVADGREWPLEGPLGFIDDSAGYHARHTRLALVGRHRPRARRRGGGAGTSWRACTTPPRRASARSGWTASRTRWRRSRSPTTSRASASSASTSGARARTTPAAVRSKATTASPSACSRATSREDLRSRCGYGVMEWHDVRW